MYRCKLWQVNPEDDVTLQSNLRQSLSLRGLVWRPLMLPETSLRILQQVSSEGALTPPCDRLGLGLGIRSGL